MDNDCLVRITLWINACFRVQRSSASPYPSLMVEQCGLNDRAPLYDDVTDEENREDREGEEWR